MNRLPCPRKSSAGLLPCRRNVASVLTGTAILLSLLGGGTCRSVRAEPPVGLREAVQKGDTAETDRLLNNTPPKDRRGANAEALTWAAYYGRADLLTDLLKRGVPPTPPDGRALTPLLAAVKGDQPDAVSILLARGADPDARPANSRSSAAELAAELGRTKVLERMGRAPVAPAPTPAREPHPTPRADPSLNPAFIAAVKAGDTAKVNALLAQGADPEARDAAGWPASILAACHGHTDILRALHKYDYNADDQTSPGQFTPIEEAVGGGHLEAVKFLLTCGVPPDGGNNYGHNAIDYAEERGYPEIAKILRDAPSPFKHR